MTTEEAVKVIYTERGYVNTYADTPDDREWWITAEGEIVGYDLPDPTHPDTEGLAEFARLVVWAWEEFPVITLTDSSGGKPCVEISTQTSAYGERPYVGDVEAEAATPQEAFVFALAAALEARKGGGEAETDYDEELEPGVRTV